MRTSFLRIVVLVLASTEVAWSDEPRFPTEAHRKFPLAIVVEHDGTNRITTAVPYQEALVVAEARGWVSNFIKRTFPLPELDSDTVRYFTGINHFNHVIPQGHSEVPRTQVGTAYLHKFVYSAGRVKNVYGVSSNGNQTHTWSAVFDDANHVVIRGSFHEGKLTEVWLVIFPPDGKFEDPKQPIQQWMRFLPSGEFRERQLYANGRLVKSERAPIPGPTDSGRYPCQALRYSLALERVVNDASLATEEKVARVLPFLGYEAEPDEGKSFGTDSYSGLHQRAVAALGNLDSANAFAALVDLVKGEPLRWPAAEALAKHRSRDALPHLLAALEAEDGAEPRRNRQQISARIVGAMFEHSPSKADALVRQFLETKQRRYQSAVETARARAREISK